jgi:tartrate-resistant acid phosphatase type 5
MNFRAIGRSVVGFIVMWSAIAPAATPATRPGSLRIFAMGDWGEDTAAQRRVADTMAQRAADPATRPDDILLLGDNFYFRLTGIDDPRWQTVFEQVYSAKDLAVPFYACLGNHDYDGNNYSIELGYAKAHPRSRFKLPSRYYRVDLPAVHPMLTLIMLDSNKDNMTDAQWSEQVKWLKTQFATPRAPWTICCAHHPMFSNGYVFFNGVLQQDWGKAMEAANVDFYLTGHEHNLQHLEIPGWKESFLIAGGGGAHQHPLFRDDRGFSRTAFGFLSFDLDETKAIVQFFDDQGQAIHTFERTKAGVVTIEKTTPNSTPQRNALQAYLELRNRSTTKPSQ